MATATMTAPQASSTTLREMKTKLILLGCIRIDGVQMFNILDELEQNREARAERSDFGRWGYDGGEDLTVIVLGDGSIWIRDGKPDDKLKEILNPDNEGVAVPSSGGWSLNWRGLITRQKEASNEVR